MVLSTQTRDRIQTALNRSGRTPRWVQRALAGTLPPRAIGGLTR